MTPSPSSRRVEEPRAQARGSGREHRAAAAASSWPSVWSPAPGYSLVELLVVVGLVGAVMTAAVPAFDRAADAADATAAARYLASVVARARLDAARRQRTVAVRFTQQTPVTFTVVADGDGDGVNAEDVAAGIDAVIRSTDRLEDHFPRVRFGIAGPVQAIDDTMVLTGSDDPVRFGAADQLTLTPLGTATGGTAYLTSRAGVQLAVRISGVTGRARVLRYDRGRAAWLAI